MDSGSLSFIFANQYFIYKLVLELCRKINGDERKTILEGDILDRVIGKDLLDGAEI